MTCRLLCGNLTIQCIWSWSHSRVEESRYLCIGCFNLDNSVCHMFCPSYFGDYATELPTKSRSLPLFWTKSLGQGHLAIWFTLEQLSCNLSHNLASQAQCMLLVNYFAMSTDYFYWLACNYGCKINPNINKIATWPRAIVVVVGHWYGHVESTPLNLAQGCSGHLSDRATPVAMFPCGFHHMPIL